METLRPHPVTTDDTGVFDTSQGTVHLVLGCGGTNAPLDEYGVDTAHGLRQAKVFTTANRPQPTTTAGVFTRSAADAVEDATWSAKRDPSTGAHEAGCPDFRVVNSGYVLPPIAFVAALRQVLAR